jgi:hypothetical protein
MNIRTYRHTTSTKCQKSDDDQQLQSEKKYMYDSYPSNNRVIVPEMNQEIRGIGLILPGRIGALERVYRYKEKVSGAREQVCSERSNYRTRIINKCARTGG